MSVESVKISIYFYITLRIKICFLNRYGQSEASSMARSYLAMSGTDWRASEWQVLNLCSAVEFT
jgi:hypothetical protein